jgi:pimeloyl-ACP methyl ester carboxylesterase
MKHVLGFFLSLAVFGSLSLAVSSQAYGEAADKTIASRTADVNGLKLHYMTAGHGMPLILLHGYAETSLMWKPIIPALAERFTVIAPDLPGIGDSEIPAHGLDMKSAAISIHELAKSLGVQKAEVVGHDIGLMVAYAYAAQFPTEVTKLVLMDAFLPGVAGWEPVYNSPNIWHFRFNGPTPEALVQGRERTYFAYFWNDLAADKNRSIPETDREAYIAAYSRPGRMHAGWAYFVSFLQAAEDFAQLSQTKLTMPVLSIGGEKSLGEALGQQTKLVATDVTVIVLKDTGHWILEEQPKETTEALENFL